MKRSTSTPRTHATESAVLSPSLQQEIIHSLSHLLNVTRELQPLRSGLAVLGEKLHAPHVAIWSPSPPRDLWMPTAVVTSESESDVWTNDFFDQLSYTQETKVCSTWQSDSVSGNKRVNLIPLPKHDLILSITSNDIDCTHPESQAFWQVIANMLHQLLRSIPTSDETVEPHWKDLIRKTPMLVFTLNAYGSFTFLSGRVLEDLAIDSKEWIGQPAVKLHSVFGDLVEYAMIGKTAPSPLIWHDQRLEIHIQPIVSPDKHFNGLIGFALDVTAHHATEERLNTLLDELMHINRELTEKNTRLRELDRLKDEFLSNVSHELRTPLTAIIGFSDILKMGMSGDLQPQQLDFISLISQRGQDLLSLINELLDSARLEAGSLSLNLSEVSVKDELQECLEMLEPQAKGAQIEIQDQLAEDFPRIIADPLRIRQILLNLIGNAIKFTPFGGRIIISGRVDLEKNQIAISVEDSGTGIPSEYQDIIFERFRQVEGGANRPQDGFGLGLNIVRSLVRLHGGDIFLESVEGLGSHFYFTLPITHTQ